MLGAWLGLKLIRMTEPDPKRTKKEFTDYNIYHDRGMMKWATAYAMDELVKGIKHNSKEALKHNPAMTQMTREEVDLVLSESFLYGKTVVIQLNLRDEFGRLLDNIEGHFVGEAYEDYFVLDNEVKIEWEDVRHISIKKEVKWFDIDMFEDKRKVIQSNQEVETEYIIDENYQAFFEEE